MTKPFCHLLVVCTFWFAASALFAAEKPWIEVESPHIRVISDGSEQDARRTAYEFEQIRSALADRFPNARFESGAPLLVLAARDERSAMKLAPWIRASQNKTGGSIAGFFETHWEKKFAVVRIDLDTSEDHLVVYHEYTHTVMHANIRWLPLWMDEGLAEFYGNTRFEKNKIFIGAPSNRYAVLQQRPLIPLDKLLFGPVTPDETQMFYAESWALVHFLYFGPGMLNGEKLQQFRVLLDRGTDQKKAFQTVFGDTTQLEKTFQEYVHRYSFNAAVINSPANIDQKSFRLRKLTLAETEAELGAYYLWSHDLKDAQPVIEAAIKDDPSLGLAREDMGFLNFDQGKDEEALTAFSKAYELDASLYLSLYYKTMLSKMAKAETAADQADFHEALLNILKIGPDFAPAYVQLSLLALLQGKNDDALAAAKQAERLEPSRAGYHLLTGKILLQLGRGQEAAGIARYVADRWTGSDRDEAVDLWHEVPEDQRNESEPLIEEIRKATQTVEGTVSATVCADKDPRVDLKVAAGGELLDFHSSGEFRSGFSDTLWYGTDHFSMCHHLEGTRVIVRYKPPQDGSYTGEIVEVEFRIDPPKTLASKGTNTAQITK